MKAVLLVVFIFLSPLAFSQAAHIQVLKNGKVKKRIPEGTYIKLTDRNGSLFIGPYRVISDSTLVIGNVPVQISRMREMKLLTKKEKHEFDTKRFAYSSLGVALSTAGMALSKWEPLPRAALYSSVLGYSNYAIEPISRISFKKKKFKVTRKRKLRIWTIDNYDPAKKPF